MTLKRLLRSPSANTERSFVIVNFMMYWNQHRMEQHVKQVKVSHLLRPIFSQKNCTFLNNCLALKVNIL